MNKKFYNNMTGKEVIIIGRIDNTKRIKYLLAECDSGIMFVIDANDFLQSFFLCTESNKHEMLALQQGY